MFKNIQNSFKNRKESKEFKSTPLIKIYPEIRVKGKAINPSFQNLYNLEVYVFFNLFKSKESYPFNSFLRI